ncbi:hypothetical protein [Sphingopyxis panaciterrae]
MLSLIMSLALSATSPEPATATPAPAPQVKPKKPKKICRANGATGTRMKSSTCKTQEEWDAEASVGPNGETGEKTVRN